MGRKWEKWQDFFWQRRNENPNADIGFNEFINCIAGLEYYILKQENAEATRPTINKLLSLVKIEHYIGALEFIEQKKEEFISSYKYAEWVNKYFALIWTNLNKTSRRNTNWFSDVKDKNRNDDRNSMVLMWSFFYYFRLETISRVDEFFRAMRFFYIRFHNYNRSVSFLSNTVDVIKTKGLADLVNPIPPILDSLGDDEDLQVFKTGEEELKCEFLLNNPTITKELEALIWEIEDQKYCLDGSYLGNTNISHLIDLSKNPSLKDLQKVRDCFLKLIDFNEEQEILLVRLLLHYGEVWHRDTPYNYYNFKFDDWRRIIRGHDGNKAFNNLFNDLLAMPSFNLRELVDQKNKEFIKQNAEHLSSMTGLREQLIVYSCLLEDELWSNGFHICCEGEPQRRLFDEEFLIFNTIRYKGGHWYLWDYTKDKFGSNRDKIVRKLLDKY